MKHFRCLLILAVAACLFVPAAYTETWQDYFKDGIHYFNVRDYKKANECFQIALEMNPPGRELKAARDAVGPAFWSSLLSKTETRAIGYRLLRQIYKYIDEQEKKEEYIKALVDLVISAETDFKTRWQTIHKIVAVGQFACPMLIKYMGETRNDDVRKAVRMVLENLEYRAVLPLVEALNADQSTAKGRLTVQNAITVLGVIGDPRAAAALSALAEKTPSEDIRNRAKKALQGIKATVLQSKQFGDELRLVKTKKDKLIFRDKRAQGLFDKEGNFKSAKKLFLYKALRYLRETQYVSEEAAKDEGAVWIWNNKKQEAEYWIVPLYAYNEIMAEEAAYDCLNLYPEYEEIIPVMVSSIAAQIVETRNLMVVAEDRAMGQNLPEGESKEALEKRLEVLKEAFVLVNMSGPEHLYKALEINEQRIARLMMEKKKDTERLERDYEEYGFDAKTFQYIAKQLRNPEMAKWREYLPLLGTEKRNDKDAKKIKSGRSLTAALLMDDKRIRYGAAITLGHLSPDVNFENASMVVPTLIKALSESKEHVVLLISKSQNDLNRMNALVGGLMGYIPQLADSGAEGLKKARQFPLEDIIVLDARDESLMPKRDAFGQPFESDYGGQTVRSFMKLIKENLYTRNIPVVFIVANEEQKVYYDNDPKMKGQISAFIQWEINQTIDENYFADVLKKGLKDIEPKDKNKQEAFNIAAEASEAFAQIGTKKGVLVKYAPEAFPTLREVIESREDPIKVPAIEALGLFGDVQAIDALVRVLAHPRSSKEARLASIRALGRIDPSNENAYTALKKVLQDKDFDIRKEAGVALGHKAFDSKKLLELFEQQRIQKELKER